MIAEFPKRYHRADWVDSPGESAIDDFRKEHLNRPVYDEAAPGLLDENFLGGRRMFSIATWSYGDFLLTPPTVLWALLRANLVGTTTSVSKVDPDKVADEFKRLLTLAGKSS